MFTLDRRDFLKTTALTSVGVMTANNVWALDKLQPVGDTLNTEYPYRDWEDLYRNEWTWDHVGYSAHCINCLGNCAFQVFVKDGIVLREEQLAQYPQINEKVPDANPRGCQKGAINSAAMYEGDRLRYPMKRVG
ncbi:MAG: twin-arginine translocation signal domain-containing protein, partial [Candidatus Competibacteraceae bacterium]|nr:twin-arginine translocation signal domain-containing protein [Candidatus Competibacteraceae bacterium]